jgi:hypothetical protein
MSDAPETEALDAPEAQAAQPETFTLDYVQGLRQEAAKYRSEKKDAVSAAKAEVARDYESKMAEKDAALAEMQGQLSTRALELLKLKAVLAEGIPSEDAQEVAALVQGSDEESVSESVKRVKALLDKGPVRDRPIDPSQGAGNDLPLNGDPLLETVKRMVGAV